MGAAQPHFPNSVWDGLSQNPNRTTIMDDQWPNHQDWDQIVQEVIEVEQYLLDNPPNNEVPLYQGVANTPLVKGQVVYVTPGSEIGLADNNSNLVSGLAITNATAGQTVVYARRGRLTLSDWTAIIGASSLMPGRDYFLASNGSLSLTGPATGYVIKMGQAQTDATFDIHIQSTIKL